jgi:flagellar hook assembly protein FlgD
LSVSVVDASGKTVRRLSSHQPTRPQQLTPAGSFFYWNGKKADGSFAAPGDYTVKVTAHIGDAPYEAVSEPFTLLDAE